MTKPPPDPDDLELFRKHMKGVKPLTQTNVVEAPRPAHRRRQSSPTAAIKPPDSGYGLPVYVPEAIDISDQNFIELRRPGIQNKLYQKLQRGQLPIAAEIDLHGMTVNRAKIALDQFMEQLAYTGKQICIHVIHGKGHGSRDRVPVIKRETQLWLQCNKNVLAYCSCKPADGGTGAVYVLVKNSN